jgi:hypothetical protein
MENQNQNQKQKYRQKEIKSVYSPCQITKNIMLHISAIGRNLKQTLETVITGMVCGKCIVEGYVKPNSVKVITFSSGLVKGDNIIFDVVFNCDICYPVSGMNLNCVAKHITKAGITAESADDSPSPCILSIARDHHYANDYFNSIAENDRFVARVIAQRFELNDTYVSIIAELVPHFNEKDKKREIKPRLIM